MSLLFDICIGNFWLTHYFKITKIHDTKKLLLVKLLSLMTVKYTGFRVIALVWMCISASLFWTQYVSDSLGHFIYVPFRYRHLAGSSSNLTL